MAGETPGMHLANLQATALLASWWSDDAYKSQWRVENCRRHIDKEQMLCGV
jgi:hypothetical protein